MAVDLSVRAVDARELMDDPDADLRMLERTYARFPLINAVVSRWRGVYRRDIRPRARRETVRILDVGAGGGDLSRAISTWAQRDGLEVEVTALDADPRAIRWACDRDAGRGVRYRCAHTTDLVEGGEVFDIVISNHLLHHLTSEELQQVLADSVRLVHADGLVVHRDIERSALAYASFAVVTLPFAGNLLADSFIRADGLTSIRRAYTARELAAVVPAGWTVHRGIPARLSLRWGDEHARS